MTSAKDKILIKLIDLNSGNPDEFAKCGTRGLMCTGISCSECPMNTLGHRKPGLKLWEVRELDPRKKATKAWKGTDEMATTVGTPECAEGPAVPAPKADPEYTGGSSDYYQVTILSTTTEGRPPYIAECNDIIEALGMNFAEGNAFKALWRRAAQRTLGKRKAGAKDDGLYDAEKVKFFGERLIAQSKEAANGKPK